MFTIHICICASSQIQKIDKTRNFIDTILMSEVYMDGFFFFQSKENMVCRTRKKADINISVG